MHASVLCIHIQTQVKALLEALAAIKAAAPQEKSVVFSQFTGFLDILQQHLTAAGHTVSRSEFVLDVLDHVLSYPRVRADAYLQSIVYGVEHTTAALTGQHQLHTPFKRCLFHFDAQRRNNSFIT